VLRAGIAVGAAGLGFVYRRRDCCRGCVRKGSSGVCSVSRAASSSQPGFAWLKFCTLVVQPSLPLLSCLQDLERGHADANGRQRAAEHFPIFKQDWACRAGSEQRAQGLSTLRCTPTRLIACWRQSCGTRAAQRRSVGEQPVAATCGSRPWREAAGFSATLQRRCAPSCSPSTAIRRQVCERHKTCRPCAWRSLDSSMQGSQSRS